MKRLILALASVVLALCAPAHADNCQTVEGTYRYGFAQGVLEEVNIERTGRGIAPLVMTSELVDAAMKRAAETSVLWSHTRPNGSRCMTAWSWVGCAGENIAYGQDEPWIVMEDWMESPGHRANILNPDYKTIGVGCFDFDGTLYWVQAFSGGAAGSRDTRNGDRRVTVDVGIVSGRDSIVRDYTIAFNANGGTGKAAVLQAFYGQSVALPAAPFVRKGFLFLGWATTKNGTVCYKDGAAVKNLQPNGGTTALYAVWAKENYKVKFVANGGKGTMKAQAMTYGKAKNLKANKFKRKGYVFKGWATSKSNARRGKVKFKNKKKVKNLVTTGKTVKLYAVWKKKSAKSVPTGLKEAGTTHPESVADAAGGIGEISGRVLVTACGGENAYAVADGDGTTAWMTDAANGAWVVLTFPELRDVEDVEILGENLPGGTRFLLSEDADDWREELPGTAQYLWVVFPACDGPLAVKEIRVLPE